MSIERFVSHGLARVPYPLSLQRQLDLTVQNWQDFCCLPDKIKRSFKYSNNAAGFGYEMKTGKGPKADRKENFDVTSTAYREVIKNPRLYSDTTALLFVFNAFALVRHLREEIVWFAKQFKGGLPGLAREVDREDAYFVRFIHYLGECEEGEELAHAHVDAHSGLTFHLYESDGGFQYLPYGKKGWKDVKFGRNQALIIPNMQMQLRSRGGIRALCHRVVATSTTAYGGRYSAVCFVALLDTPQYDKDRHGRVQEKPPGFNYNMPFDEFKKLFKS